MSVSMADIGSEMMGVSISEWAELAKKVTNIIECRIKVQIIIKESAAMGSLFTIWANDELLCKDLPRKKALNQLDKYLIGV